MIRELNSIKENELNSLLGTTVEVVEKIDAPYFIIEFKNREPHILKSNHEELTDVDILINDMYERINRFVTTKIKGLPIYNATIGLWYFPTEKPRKITYDKYKGKFMLAYYDENITQEQINMLYNNGILPTPIIAKRLIVEKDIALIKKLANGTYSNLFFLMNFLKGIKFFGTPYQDMEGVIFKTNNKPFQVILSKNEEKTNDAQKKMYRDVILKDFITWYYKTLPYITENASYIEKVTNLFIKYSEWTDVVNKYSIEKEDLMPPYTGFMGDICYDKIPNREVAVICRNDFIMKGIYKILINSCRKELKKFDGDLLNSDDILKFNKIVEEIRTA